MKMDQVEEIGQGGGRWIRLSMMDEDGED